jgi:hypothetical protein
MFEQAPEGYGTAWASSKQGLQECGYGFALYRSGKVKL